MLDRYCAIYHLQCPDLQLAQTINLLEANGIQLLRPGESTPLRLTQKGDRITSSLEELQAHSAERGGVNFLMWSDISSQLYVTYESRNGGVNQKFEFSALRHSASFNAFWAAMFALFRRALDLHKAIGMIVDAHGHTEEFDWDGFFLDTSLELPSELPDYLALPRDKAERLRYKFPGFEDDNTGFSVYNRNDRWRESEVQVSML